MILIIAGHSRSGTSILMRLCNSHPQIALTTELGSFAYLSKTVPEYNRLILKRWQYLGQRWPASIWGKNNRITKKVTNTIFFARFLLAMRRERGDQVTHLMVENALKSIYPTKLFVGDKWPYYTLMLPEFSQIKEIKCVVIYRDCRDVVSSFLEKVRTKWMGQEWISNLGTADEIAASWVHMINIMEAHADSLHLIRYEKLAYNPRQTLHDLGQWLEIDPQLFFVEQMNASSVGKYKTGLTSDELAAVMRISGPTMARLGYI